jgi:hypothetical protein
MILININLIIFYFQEQMAKNVTTSLYAFLKKNSNKKAVIPDGCTAFFILGMKRKRGDVYLLNK